MKKIKNIVSNQVGAIDPVTLGIAVGIAVFITAYMANNG